MKKLPWLSFTFLSFFLFYFCTSSFAQTKKIDSLLLLLKKDKPDTNKVNHFNNLSREYINAGNYDSSLIVSKQALDLGEKLGFKKGIAVSYNSIGVIYRNLGDYIEALKNFNQSLKIRKEINDKKGIADAYTNIGIVNGSQGNYPEAINFFSTALKIQKEIGDKKGIASSYSSIGNVFYYQGNHPEALKNYFAALKINEAIGNKNGAGTNFNNIGSIYGSQGNYTLALKYFFSDLKIEEAIGNKDGIASSLVNLGGIYFDQHNYPEALKKFFTSLKFFELIGNKHGIAHCHHNIAAVYTNQGKHSEALKNYFISLKIREEIGDKEGAALTYSNIGNIYTQQKQYNQALKYLLLAKKFSIAMGIKSISRDTYRYLSKLDSAEGNYKSAYENHKLYIRYRDSIDNEESRKKTIQNQMTYDFEKKEAATKAAQDIKDALTLEESRKQKLITGFVIGGLFLVMVFTAFIFRSLRVTRQQKHLIELQKNEVSQQKELVEKQKLIVEEHQKEIIDSIRYAQRIQKAILPRRSEIHTVLPESFILYQPKDIVAGDFYWAEKTRDYYFIAAADCTGHGVPGALVSMVCSNALNRTVNEFGISETGKILDKARELVLDAFKKSGEEIKDGMDISLLRISKAGSEIQWSGANNPLWYFLNDELVEVKADKQAIGKNEAPQPFTTHHLELSKGTNLYLFTDGYADQFNASGKKMTKKKFKDLVISVQGKSMPEQKQVLTYFFENWKGPIEQIDDVCVIGIRM